MSQTSHPDDPFNLRRFIIAQIPCYPAVVDELRKGKKQTHWMWFAFPQVGGLGRSSMAMHFAIHSREEGAAYLATPLLRARLVECASLVLAHRTKSAHDIFGAPDNLKFWSSMTLFDALDGSSIYTDALNRFFGGELDQGTIDILHHWNDQPS
jgi:uncharacterized protein (DUF1810 family)